MSTEPSQQESGSGGGLVDTSRRRIKSLVAILAAFGVLSALGGYAVKKLLSEAEETFEETALISVNEDPQGGGDGFHVATRSPIGLDATFADVMDCSSLFVAAKDAGAVDVRAVREAVQIEGDTRRDLSIVGMRARVLRREPALAGASIGCQSAGAQGGIGVLFNLDEALPLARAITQFDSLQFGAPYFASGNIVRLVKGEEQPFMMVGFSETDYVEWEVEADVIVDGDTRTITINNDGAPFRVTGSPSGGTRYKRYYEWVWYPEPQRLWVGDHPRSS